MLCIVLFEQRSKIYCIEHICKEHAIYRCTLRKLRKLPHELSAYIGFLAFR